MKKIAGFLAFLTACLILLLGVTPLFFVGRVSHIVEAQCDKNLQATVRFGDLSLNLFRHFPQLTVTLSDLQVTGVDTFRQDTLVKAEKIRLVVDLVSILSEEGVSIKQVDLVSPGIKCVALQDGRANWNIMKPDSAIQASADTSVVHVALRKITIKDACLVYEDRETGMEVVLDQWSGVLNGNLSSKRTTLETRSLVKALSFRYGGSTFVDKAKLEADMMLEADFDQSRYDLSTNRVVLNDMPVSFKGFVQLPDTSTIRMDLVMNTDEVTFKQVLSLVPALYQKEFQSLKASGDVRMSAFAKGDWKEDTYPAFEITLALKNGTFSYPDLPSAVTDMVVDARLGHTAGSLDKTVVDVNRFHMAMAGQPIDATLHLSTPISNPAMDASFRGTVDLGRIRTFYPLDEKMELKGTLKADLRVAGALSDVEKKRYDNIRASGSAQIKGVRFKQTDGTPVTIDRASLSLTPAALKLETLSMNLGKNDLQASGSLGNYLQWFMNKGVLTGNLDVLSNYLNLNELMAEEKSTATKSASGRAATEPDTVSLTAFDVPKNMDLALKARVSEMTFSKLVLANLEGTVRVRSGRVVLDNIRANSMGGTLGVDGAYVMDSPGRPMVDLSLSLKDVSYKQTATSLSTVRELAPIFEKIQGTYSMNLKMKTLMDNHYNPQLNNLSAQGRLQSSNLKLSGVKVLDMLAATLKRPSLSSWSPKNVDVSFKVSDGRIKTAPFSLKMQNVGLLFEGSSGIDRTLDYKVTATLPVQLSIQGLSTVDGTITGTFDKPALKMDMAGLAKQAAKGVAEKVVKQLTGGTIDQQVAKAKEAIDRQAEQLRAQARAAGDKLINEAGKEGDRLIEKAGNPVLKVAAKATADRLKAKARERAAALETEAEEKIKALYKEQGLNP